MARGPIFRVRGTATVRTKAQLMAARDEAVAKVKLLLADGPKSMPELCKGAGVARPTLFSYLRFMHKKQRSARPLGKNAAGSPVWELGADPDLPSDDELLDRLFAVKQSITPAQQAGMRRDPLVAALFGQAPVALITTSSPCVGYAKPIGKQ